MLANPWEFCETLALLAVISIDPTASTEGGLQSVNSLGRRASIFSFVSTLQHG